MDVPADEGSARTLGAMLLAWTPSPEDLINAVFARSENWSSPIHGEEHWRGVAHVGLVMGAHTPGADPRLVFLFGLLHDAMRQNEYDDPDHGRRASELLGELIARRMLDLPEAQEHLLSVACSLHADGETSPDPTIGTCWDADRLNLWRLGWAPSESLLSTADGRSPERVEWAREAIRAVPSWAELLSTRW